MSQETQVGHRASAPPSGGLVLLLGGMIVLGGVTVDLYLPSLPAVARDLGTSPAAAQATISAGLIGAAAGQLVVGPLSDRYGRRLPALVGLVVHVVTSVGCMLAPTVGALVGLRLLQGVAVAACGLTAMAVVRDRCSDSAAARVISRLMLVFAVTPLIAPWLGGMIAGAAGWRAVFGVLALAGAAVLAVVWRWLPETLPREARRAGGIGPALRGYAALARDRRFVVLAVLGGLAWGVIISWIVGSPFTLQVEYGLSQERFGLVVALMSAALMSGFQVNAVVVRTVEPLQVVRVATPAALVLAVLLMVIMRSGAGGLVGLLGVVWLLLATVSMIAPNTFALALTRHGERAGSATALLEFLQQGTAALGSLLVGGLGGGGSATATAILVAAGATLLLLALGTPTYRRG
ncbi:multidrug effflux MFS transporter [Nocardioides sp. GCM10027113]|uniref:multidrug effflux MFS transporter n=1 Tax=unclassified Nocardioides TaxID=2615069 RepID=UPI003620BE17